MTQIAPDDRKQDGGLAPLGLVALVALYALTHPFAGFTGDAQIYMGRALADLDPTGVGTDVMFRLDGQSRFSIFPALAAWLVAHMPPIDAAMLLVGASGALWCAAAVALARAAAPSRPLAVAAVLVLAPTFYGGFNLLRYAEGLAIPRPFAEAFVLFALAAFVANRRLVAMLCLAVAAAFHPIMALAGVATVALCLCMEDRRWLIAAAALVAAMLAATFAGAPFLDRLRTVIDAEWLDLLKSRNAYLFPHLWPASAWALPAVQAITILVAVRRASPALRRLLLASLIVGAAGVVVALLAGLYEPVLLVMQAQLWRMWWLTAAMAALALGLCALNLGACSARERLSLALLALAWALAQEAGLYAPLVAALAFALDRLSGLKISDEIGRAFWLGAGVAVIAPLAVDLPSLQLFGGLFQPDFAPAMMPLVLKFAGPPLLFGAVALAAFGLPDALAARVWALGAATAALAAVAGMFWNDASSFDRKIGGGGRQADLERMMPDRAGDVLWLYGSLEPALWLGRPSWSADMQGAGAVFSRELAMTYRDRARAQIDAGLRDETIIKRVPYRPKTFHPAVTRESVAAICGRKDGPASIVAPVSESAALDPALKAKIWTPPAVRVEMLFKGDGVEFPRLDRYAIVGCAGLR